MGERVVWVREGCKISLSSIFVSGLGRLEFWKDAFVRKGTSDDDFCHAGSLEESSSVFTGNEHKFTGRTVYSSVARAEENRGGQARNQPGITHFNSQHTRTHTYAHEYLQLCTQSLTQKRNFNSTGNGHTCGF